MQIIRAATAKSDWRRRACDFAVVDSPLSPPPHTHARTSAPRKKGEDWPDSSMRLTNWLLTGPRNLFKRYYTRLTMAAPRYPFRIADFYLNRVGLNLWKQCFLVISYQAYTVRSMHGCFNRGRFEEEASIVFPFLKKIATSRKLRSYFSRNFS